MDLRTDIKAVLHTLTRSEWVMVILTFVIAGTGVVGIFLVIQGGKDSKRIADAAEKQVRAAQKSADAAGDFAATAALINTGIGDAVSKLNLQAASTRNLAGQALQQTTTAREALHVSERAYVGVVAPSLDGANKVIYLPITNTGHIPSGIAEIIGHEATFNVTEPTIPTDPSNVIEKSWKRTILDAVPPGTPIKLVIFTPALSWNQLINSHQIVIVAGSISYNDGFPDTPRREIKFCWSSVNVVQVKEIDLRPCDSNVVLPILERLDGYPNNEER